MTTKAALLRAVRAKCLDCSCYQPSEVRLCPVTRCALWPFRFGRDPEPGPARGCAKGPLGREKTAERGPSAVSDTGSAHAVSGSCLPRGDLGARKAVPSPTAPASGGAGDRRSSILVPVA